MPGPGGALPPRHPSAAAHPLQRLGGVGDGAGEHETDRPEELDRCGSGLAGLGSDGRLAEVAGQHVDPFDHPQGQLEGLRDRLLDEALLEPDPEVVRHHFDDVLGRSRVEPTEELGQPFELGRHAARRLDLGEGRAHLLERGRLRLGVTGQHVLGPVARVGMLQVDPSQLVAIGSRQCRHRLPHRGAAELERPGIVEAEGPAGHPGGRKPQVGRLEAAEVAGEESRLLQLGGGLRDRVGRARESQHVLDYGR